MNTATAGLRRLAELRGRRAEIIAAMLLMAKGYRLLGRRVRTKAGEIDLIFRSPKGVLCFVEVKARARHQDALDSVRLRQQSRIARAAGLYVAQRPGAALRGMRFDLVTVSRRGWPRHLQGAWQACSQPGP